MKKVILLTLGLFLVTGLTGCTVVFQRGRRSDVNEIQKLYKQLDEFETTKLLLEQRLKQEIADKSVRLERAEKGLVITFVADVMFDSGKAELRPQSLPTLDKVVRILKENVPGYDIGIEGHTDNEPIRHSPWKSNWDLSVARALGVLHYLVEQKGIAAERVSATGYGQHRPIASNATPDGRQLNRRVEIVVLPQITKVREAAAVVEEKPKLK